MLPLLTTALATAQQPVRVQSDARGWPVLDEPTPARMPPTSAPRDGARPSAEPNLPDAAATARTNGRSPLDAIYQRIGHPSAFQALGCVVARVQVTAFDDQGAETFRFELLHDADLRRADRDRLVFAADQRTYGRDGASTWVRVGGLSMPTLEAEAKEEIELLGRLLRLPWDFDDANRWFVRDLEPTRWQGLAAVRSRIEARPQETDVYGPVDVGDRVDRYELFAAADSKEPTELRYTLTGVGLQRRMLLLDWQKVNGVLFPMRRVIVDTEGRKQLEMTFVRVDVGQELPASQFQPR